jgi:hypothetical protein
MAEFFHSLRGIEGDFNHGLRKLSNSLIIRETFQWRNHFSLN